MRTRIVITPPPQLATQLRPGKWVGFRLNAGMAEDLIVHSSADEARSVAVNTPGRGYGRVGSDGSHIEVIEAEVRPTLQDLVGPDRNR